MVGDSPLRIAAEDNGRLRGAPWLPFLHQFMCLLLHMAHSSSVPRTWCTRATLDVPFSWSDSRSCSHPIYSTIACSENGRQMGTAGIAMPSYARLSLLVSDEARVSTDSQSSPNGVRYKWANALVPPTPFQGWRKKCADI